MAFEKFNPGMLDRMRKWFAAKLNPFNLCPGSVTFWFIVPPYSAIGLMVTDLRNINVYWRQQIEPNETTYLMNQIFSFRLPLALTLLVLFASFGLTITDAAYRLIQAVRTEYENENKKIRETIDGLASSLAKQQEEIKKIETASQQQALAQALDPFRLTPRMSVFFSVYDTHTLLGFLTIDFGHIEFSLAQALEPNDTIYSIFRFLDLYSPFPLQIASMILSFGLFILGSVYKYGLAAREEVIDEVNRAFKR